MPLAGKVRYRVKQTSEGPVRLAFRNNTVIEAKNLKTGEMHSEKEFLADKAKRRGKLGTK